MVVIALAMCGALAAPLIAGAFWPVTVTGDLLEQARVRFATDSISPLPLRRDEWVVQPWLSALIMRTAWVVGGPVGLSALGALLAAVAAGLLYRLARRYAASPAAALSVLAVLPLLIPLTIQTQLFAVACAAGTMLALVSRRPWLAPPIVVLWANVHGSAMIGTAMCCTAALGMLRGADHLVQAGWPSRIATAIASAVALLATPLGIGVFAYTKSVRGVAALQELTPIWRSLDLFGPRGIYFSCIVVGILAMRVPELVRGGRVQWGRAAFLLPTVVLAVGAASTARHVAWFAVWAVPELASILGTYWRRSERSPTLDSRLVGASLIGASLIILAVLVPGGPTQARIARLGLPSDDVVKLVGLDGRAHTFASLEWASYLRLRTGTRVYADARLERFRDRDLATYLAITRGNLNRLVGIAGCGATSPDYRPVTALVVRRRGAPHLVKALERRAGGSIRAGDTIRVGRLQITIRTADTRGIAGQLGCTRSASTVEQTA